MHQQRMEQDQLLLTPVGNKINIVNLTTNVSNTLPFQNISNIGRLVISPDQRTLTKLFIHKGCLWLTLISVDNNGFALIVNLAKRVVFAHFNFRNSVTAAFSPDNKFFFVATGTKCKIFESPSVDHKKFSPLLLYKKYNNLHSQKITRVTWTNDSRFILTWI